MSHIRTAATAPLAAVEQAGDVLGANLTTARDEEATLGIPLPMALMGEWVCLGASRRYASTWPAHFCDTMQPNQHLFAVVWQVRGGVLQSMREVGRDGDLLGERMLAVLAHATMPYRSLMRTCASIGNPIDLCLAYTGFPATSERTGNSMDLSTIDRLYASLSTTWLIRITEEEATAAEAMVATMRLLSHALAASVAGPDRPREVLLQEREAHIREAAAIAQGRLGVICDHAPSVVHEEDDAGPV